MEQSVFPNPLFKNLLEVASVYLSDSDILKHPVLKLEVPEFQDEVRWVKTTDVAVFILEQFDKEDYLVPVAELCSRLSPHSFGPLGYLLYNAQSWQDWATLFNEYSHIFGWSKSICTMTKLGICFPFSQSKSFTASNVINHLDLCLCLKAIEFCIGKYSFSATVAAAEHQLESLSKVFPSFNFVVSKKDTHIVFDDKNFCDERLNANSKLKAFFLGEVQYQIKSLAKQSNIVSRIREVLRKEANLADVSLKQIASQLHLSERTLNRYLTEEHTTYKATFNRFRSKLALELLFEGHSIEDTASRLGFSERATFERAFKKWQGYTPAQMQTQYSALSQERLVEDIIHPDNIPTLPVSATRLLAVLNDDDTHIDTLVEIVSQDPGLAAKVMRIAGSALYADKNITSLKHAILSVLGTERLKSVAIMLLSTALFDVEDAAFNLQRFWIQSLTTAFVMDELNKTEKLDPNSAVDIYFLGLFLDIGSLFIAHCLPEKQRAMHAETPDNLSVSEFYAFQQNRIGLNGVQASAFLAAYWNLPHSLCDYLKAAGKRLTTRPENDRIIETLLCVTQSSYELATSKQKDDEQLSFTEILAQNMLESGLEIPIALTKRHDLVDEKISALVNNAHQMM